MAKFLTFASGWKKDNGRIGCAANGDNCNLFDPETKTAEKLNLALKLVDGDGNEREITNFYIKEIEGGGQMAESGNRRPTHQVIVALEE